MFDIFSLLHSYSDLQLRVLDPIWGIERIFLSFTMWTSGDNRHRYADRMLTLTILDKQYNCYDRSTQLIDEDFKIV